MSNKTMEKWSRVADLVTQVHDPLVAKFFDLSSDELLDEKIEVLEQLVAGKAPADIPKYYDILELYPKAGIWD